jgi:DNA invertase Pin-like site-specific DNA recombinase
MNTTASTIIFHQQLKQINMKKAILYLRLRSDKDPGKSRTLHSQEQQFRDYCSANGIEIAGIYRENWLPGKKEHPLFKEALSKLEQGNGKISLLMFQNWNGTARNVWETSGMDEKLRERKVRARIVEPGIELTMIKNI